MPWDGFAKPQLRLQNKPDGIVESGERRPKEPTEFELKWVGQVDVNEAWLLLRRT